MRFLRIVLIGLLSLVPLGTSAAPTFRVALVATTEVVNSRPVLLAVGDGLVNFDPQTGLAAPGLASTWAVTADGKDWTFTLKVAKWSDGKVLTSTEVAEAWRRSARGLVLLETPTPRTLRVVFSSAPVDPTVFALPPFLLLPHPQTGRSLGPFLAQPTVPGQPLVLLKNPHYRDAKLIGIDRLEFVSVPTPGEATALYREGRVDWVPRGGGPGTWPLKGLKDAVVAPGPGTVFLRLNIARPRLGDAGYRRLLAQALDRTSLASGLRGPLLVPAPVSTLPATSVYGPLPEPALNLVHPVGETYRTLALEVAAQWRRSLGLSVVVRALPYDQVKALRASRDYEVVLSSWWDDYPAPSAFLGLFRTGNPENDVGWTNPDFEVALDRFRSLPPGKVRTAALEEARRLLATDGAVIPLLSFATVNQINLKKWRGWYANAVDIHPWPGVGVSVPPRPRSLEAPRENG